MRILTWNLRHGGGGRLPAITAALIDVGADIFVLTEYRKDFHQKLADPLAAAGWRHQLSSNPADRTNGIFFASKSEIQPKETPASLSCPHRWLECSTSDNVNIVGVHIPGSTDKWGKEPFWKGVTSYAREHVGDRTIILGDFNTGFSEDAQGTPFTFSNYMEELLRLGWVDAWRSRNPGIAEFTWYSSANNGFRLDYGFLSPALVSSIRSVSHVHRLRNPTSLSDHAPLELEIDTDTRNPRRAGLTWE